jgi:hypothetical protein
VNKTNESFSIVEPISAIVLGPFFVKERISTFEKWKKNGVFFATGNEVRSKISNIIFSPHYISQWKIKKKKAIFVEFSCSKISINIHH